MKASIITVCFNAEDTIEDTIGSVLGQTHSDVEYIIIDGESTDGTLKIVEKYKDRIDKIVSEPDEGIFDAMNKGIKMATGEVVGILNADDFYASPRVLKKVVEKFRATKADCLWGDLVYVGPDNTERVIRRWESSPYRGGKFQKGWMPPHPTFFVKKEIYEEYGGFNKKFRKVSADYELMLRFLEKHKIKSAYIPEVLVKMRGGGNSNRSIKQVVIGNWECYKSWGANGLKVSPFFIFLKLGRKINQFINK